MTVQTYTTADIPTLDPMGLKELLWPQERSDGIRGTYFYAKQREMIYSVRDNFETYVVAGNKLGIGPRLR